MLQLQRTLGQSIVFRSGRHHVTMKLTHLTGGNATFTLRTSRAPEESFEFTLNGERVSVSVSGVKQGSAYVAIDAPKNVDIVRNELIGKKAEPAAPGAEDV